MDYRLVYLLCYIFGLGVELYRKRKPMLSVIHMFKICAIVFTVIFSISHLEACSLVPTNSWYLSEGKITEDAEFVWEGRVEKIEKDESLLKSRGLIIVKYHLILLKNIKGKIDKAGSKIELGPYQYDSGKKTVSYGKDCKLLVYLEEGKTYRVIHNVFSPYAFVKVNKK